MTVPTEQGLFVRDMRVGYRGGRRTTPVVKGVDLQLAPGEALGIVGESGCGKSTLALALAGLLRADEAEVSAADHRYDGNDMRAMSDASRMALLGRRIGFVFQNPHVALNPVLTVGRQLTDHMRFHLGLNGAQASARAVALLNEVGIADAAARLNAYPHEFSGGMLQRVTIAMALACDPDLLIADEPTTALDASVQADIVELIAEIRARRRLSLIWITHDLALLQRIVDRVVVMYAGRIVENGTIEEVYTAPLHPYARALLDTIVGLWSDESPELRSIEGAPPRPGQAETGCSFRPRCPLAFKACAEVPPLRLEAGRQVACWNVTGGRVS